MKVLIDGKYAYVTDLADVQVGDEMVLPGRVSGLWTGIVTALSPAYDGPCEKAIGLSRRRAQVESEQASLAEVRIEGWGVGEAIAKRCSRCGAGRPFVIDAVNKIGRPTSLSAKPCECGAPGVSCGLGSAQSFRYFMIEPETY